MPTLVPTHTVILSRPHKDGRKDKDGNPVHQRVSPKIGEPFEFTDDEAKDVRTAHPTGVREPVNEGGTETKEDADVEQAVREAHEAAAQNRSARADAATTARAGALGKGARKQPDNSGAGETESDDDDL
jgi:hypothetical protein